MPAAWIKLQKIPDLGPLEDTLQIPICRPSYSSGDLWPNGKEVGAGLIPKASAFGVLIRIEFQQNVFWQVGNFLFASFQMRFLKWYLAKRGGVILGVYGIYPTVAAPTIVYGLGTRAEEYSNECVLPTFKGKWDASLRRFLMRIGGFHPSLGGIILVVKKV